MSLHSSTSKVGTTELLSQGYGHSAFQSTHVEPSRVQTTTVQTAPATTVREVKTVTTEVSKHSEGVSAGEIPTTVVTTEVIKGRPISPVHVTTSQVHGGGFTTSQVYGGEFATSQVYGGGVGGFRAYGEEVPAPIELKEHGHGNIVFRPIEGRFYKNDGYGEMINPYCKIKVGHHSQKGSLSKTGGVDVAWNDLIKLERKHKEKFAKVKCKDKNRVNLHSKLGYCLVDLNEVAEKGKICGWFPLYNSENDNKINGELLLEVQDLSATGPTVV